MTNVNNKDNKPLDHPDFQTLPSHTLGCLTPGCIAYRQPKDTPFVFWDSDQPYATLQCRRCEKSAPPTHLYRHQGAWNNPYYGLGTALLSSLVIWLLPYSLLPWSTTAKGIISILCAMTIISLAMQLIQRQRRMRGFELLGYLGEPANLPSAPEGSLHLQEQLTGKVASLDGPLKAQILAAVSSLRKRVFPALMRIEYALKQLAQTPLEQLQDLAERAQLTPEETTWTQARLTWLQQTHAQADTWHKDIKLVRHLFDSIGDDLESLKYGDHNEKEEAKQALSHHISDAKAMLQRIETNQPTIVT